MGDSTKPAPGGEGQNPVTLPTSEDVLRESGPHSVVPEQNITVEHRPTANDGGSNVNGLRASIADHVGGVLDDNKVVVIDFSKVRNKGIQRSDRSRKNLETSAVKPQKGLKKAKVKAKTLHAASRKEVPTHPDEDEISKYPVLVEFIKNIDEGYEVVADVFCKMRLALRESLVKAGAWEGASSEMPDRQYWLEPISLEKAVERLESPDLDKLVDKISNPKIPDDVRDLEDDRLFGIVAHTILMMERRFLRFKFDDAFINSICDQLVERFGKKDKGIRQLIVTKMGPDYDLFTRKQAEQRWGYVKIVNSDVLSPSSERAKGGGPRLVIDEDPDSEK